jgi:hypothetical protein
VASGKTVRVRRVKYYNRVSSHPRAQATSGPVHAKNSSSRFTAVSVSVWQMRSKGISINAFNAFRTLQQLANEIMSDLVEKPLFSLCVGRRPEFKEMLLLFAEHLTSYATYLQNAIIRSALTKNRQLDEKLQLVSEQAVLQLVAAQSIVKKTYLTLSDAVKHSELYKEIDLEPYIPRGTTPAARVSRFRWLDKLALPYPLARFSVPILGCGSVNFICRVDFWIDPANRTFFRRHGEVTSGCSGGRGSE